MASFTGNDHGRKKAPKIKIQPNTKLTVSTSGLKKTIIANSQKTTGTASIYDLLYRVEKSASSGIYAYLALAS